jgi:hypothetical protein
MAVAEGHKWYVSGDINLHCEFSWRTSRHACTLRLGPTDRGSGGTGRSVDAGAESSAQFLRHRLRQSNVRSVSESPHLCIYECVVYCTEGEIAVSTNVCRSIVRKDFGGAIECSDKDRASE